MNRREQIAEHLKFYGDLGVEGVSRDAVWGARAGQATGRQQATGGRQQATGDRQQATGGRQQATGDRREAQGDVHDPGAPLSAIRDDIGDCVRCKLCTLGRRQIVFGVGNPRADLMFVGEAPGRDEDIQGIPFVGRAGQKLTQIIASIGLSRDDVYIANVIKCRPPENRNPEPDEVEQCEPFLFRQIDTIQPRVIVALGTFAARSLLKTSDPISRLRGRVYDYRGAKLVPTFHPAFLLRNPNCRRDVWEDMKKVRALLAGEDAS